MTLESGDILVYDGNNWVNSSYTSYTKVSLLQPPPPTQDYGLLNLGNGGFAGHGTGTNFNGLNAGGTILAANAASGFVGSLMDLQVAGVSRHLVTVGGQATLTYYETGNSSASVYPLQLAHLCSGAAGVGFGLGIRFMGQNSNAAPNNSVEIGNIQCVETNPTASILGSYITFYITMAGTEAEILRLYNTGTAPGQVWCKGDFFHNPSAGGMLGFFGQGPVVRQSVTGSRGSQTVTVLTNLLSALNTVGIIQDNTTA